MLMSVLSFLGQPHFLWLSAQADRRYFDSWKPDHMIGGGAELIRRFVTNELSIQ
jgi:hypothetical protein